MVEFTLTSLILGAISKRSGRLPEKGSSCEVLPFSIQLNTFELSAYSFERIYPVNSLRVFYRLFQRCFPILTNLLNRYLPFQDSQASLAWLLRAPHGTILSAEMSFFTTMPAGLSRSIRPAQPMSPIGQQMASPETTVLTWYPYR